MPNRPVLEGGPHDFDPNPPSGGGGSGGGSTGVIGGSPGLLTSTGGLFGLFPILMIPVFDAETKIGSIYTYDTNNFKCESDCEYFFRAEDLKVGYEATVKKLILVYKNIGEARIIVGVNVFLKNPPKDKDKFQQEFVEFSVGTKEANKKLYTVDIDLIITGERPQPFVKVLSDKGQFSLVSLTMIGKLQEENKL